jgi:hypothetical protein
LPESLRRLHAPQSLTLSFRGGRTLTAAWYLAPDHRFVVIPAVIVGVYGVTIIILEQRWRALSRSTDPAATA